jgi:hypothetical protein
MAMVEEGCTAVASLDRGFIQNRSFMMIQMSHTFSLAAHYRINPEKMQDLFFHFSKLSENPGGFPAKFAVFATESKSNSFFRHSICHLTCRNFVFFWIFEHVPT